MKLSEETIETICTEIKRGVPLKQASECAGVSHQTVKKWIGMGELEPEDSHSLYRLAYDEITRAKALAVAYKVETLRKATEAGDWRASAWWLERTTEEFAKKSVVDANLNANVNQLNLSELFSDEELDKIIEEEKENKE